jgi:phage/plasmid primase-like uncharacterized protein
MPAYTLDEIKSKAAGRWPDIINRVAGIPDDYLTIKHGPCPKCGGNDRFRVFNDFRETGGCVCSKCDQKLADGFETIRWYLGVDFPAALAKVAEHLGVEVARSSRKSRRQIGRNPVAPSKPRKDRIDKERSRDQLKHLTPIEWDQVQVAIWCLKKKPLTPEAVKRSGGMVARYKDQMTVIAIPVSGEDNWIVYNITGGKLPAGKKEEREWIKVKNLTRNPGLAGMKKNNT